jgi:hypothetical protein
MRHKLQIPGVDRRNGIKRSPLPDDATPAWQDGNGISADAK